MKLKKTLGLVLILTIFSIINLGIISNATPGNNAIINLQNQIKDLQKKLKQYQSQTLVQPLNISYSFNGNVKSGQYYDGSITVPQAFSYNGVIYAPVKYIAGNLNQQASYDSKSKTVYIGTTPSGNAFDLSKPFFTDGRMDINKTGDSDILMMGGNQYQVGICATTYTFSGVKTSYNLSGKYTNMTGLLGLDDTGNKAEGIVEFYGDDKVIATYDIKAGSLPQTFNVDLTGIVKLGINYKAVMTGNESVCSVDVVNVTVK